MSQASSRTVLVVDDDQDIRDALCELLIDEGYRVATAANGAEALDYLRSRELPCVILLDLMMPIMDGWEFRRQQQADAKLCDIPVVVITAAGEHRASTIAVDRILRKPLQLDHVLETLEAFC